MIAPINGTIPIAGLGQIRFDYSAESIKAIGEPFWWLVDRLNGLSPSEYFSDNFPELITPLNLNQATLINYVKGHRENSELDYSDPLTFINFDRAYFYRNFLKCLIAAHYLMLELPQGRGITRVIDVGAGVGTFSVACNLLQVLPNGEYLLIDKSGLQISLAEKLSRHLGFTNFSFLKRDIFGEFDRRGVRVASYWLCGNKAEVLRKSDVALDEVLKDGFVVIDYEKNIIDFAFRISNKRRRLLKYEIHAPLPEKVEKLVGTRSLNVHMLIVEPIRS